MKKSTPFVVGRYYLDLDDIIWADTVSLCHPTARQGGPCLIVTSSLLGKLKVTTLFLTISSLLRLSEQGIVSCIQIRRASFEVKCEGSSPRALALGGAAPAFILLAGGYMLATVIMMVER